VKIFLKIPIMVATVGKAIKTTSSTHYHLNLIWKHDVTFTKKTFTKTNKMAKRENCFRENYF